MHGRGPSRIQANGTKHILVTSMRKKKFGDCFDLLWMRSSKVRIGSTQIKSIAVSAITFRRNPAELPLDGALTLRGSVLAIASTACFATFRTLTIRRTKSDGSHRVKVWKTNNTGRLRLVAVFSSPFTLRCLCGPLLP